MLGNQIITNEIAEYATKKNVSLSKVIMGLYQYTAYTLTVSLCQVYGRIKCLAN